MKINLKPGEVMCNRCNGTGKNFDKEFVKIWGITDCPKCWGKGKLDWVENFTGIIDPYLELKEGII